VTATAETIRQDIRRLLARLPRQDLQIVLMSRSEGLTDEEIGLVVGATSAEICNKRKDIITRIERALKLKAKDKDSSHEDHKEHKEGEQPKGVRR